MLLEESAFSAHPETTPSNPYGDVALGVECAWPESIPAVEPRPGLAVVEAFSNASTSVN